jgi:hypothetical protein
LRYTARDFKEGLMFRQFSIFAAIVCPSLGFTQIFVYDGAYNLEADARSGSFFDTHSSSSPGVGRVQTYFDRVDSMASDPPSMAHSWASVFWNCTPTDLDAELVACWDSLDFGAGTSGHMLSQLWLGITLTAINVVSTVAVFDPPNSFAEIDRWDGTTWIPYVSSTQIVNYVGVWQPGDYRLHAERLYDPVGNSTDCPPFAFHLHAEPVPEPAGILPLAMGAGLLLFRRRARIS